MERLLPLLAHRGNITPEGAITFAWMMIALGSVLALFGLVRTRGSGLQGALTGVMMGAPFVLLAGWFFAFAAMCQHGVPRGVAWGITLAGTPISLWLLLRLIRTGGEAAPADNDSDASL